MDCYCITMTVQVEATHDAEARDYSEALGMVVGHIPYVDSVRVEPPTRAKLPEPRG